MVWAVAAGNLEDSYTQISQYWNKKENDDDSFIYLDDDDNNSFIDDASEISESVCEHYSFQNVEVNTDDVLKNVH